MSEVTRSPNNYEDGDEKPVEDGITRIKDENYELVYKREAFYLSTNSFYDSFKIESLKRTIYTYLDNYTNDENDNSVDMFFTKKRASWIDLFSSAWQVYMPLQKSGAFFIDTAQSEI